MASGVFNIARGRVAHYASQAGVGNAAIITVLLQDTGLEADDVLRDHDDLGAILGSTNTECDFTNYARQTITSVTPTIDDGTNTLDEAVGSLTYNDAGGTTDNNISKILFCFDPDTTVGTDADLIPLTFHEPSTTPPVVTDGSTITFNENADGFYGSIDQP